MKELNNNSFLKNQDLERNWFFDINQYRINKIVINNIGKYVIFEYIKGYSVAEKFYEITEIEFDKIMKMYLFNHSKEEITEYINSLKFS